MWTTVGSLVVSLTLQNPGSAAETTKPAPAPVTPPAQTAPEKDRPFSRFFPNLRDDIKKLPSSQTLLLVLAGTAGSAIAGAQDREGNLWAFRTGDPTNASRFGGAAGEGWIQAGVAVGTYAIGELAGKPSVTHLGTDLIRAQVLNGLVTTGLKYSVDRTRPNGGSYSFPSGHTSASFATATVLQSHYGWKAGAPAYALATFIGWTRVRDHFHWSSDIVSGATIGAIAGFAVTKAHRHRSWVITPTPTPGGFAVYVAKLPLSQKAKGTSQK